MAAIFTSTIPPQSSELIRDRIATILALELPNQFALDTTYPPVRKVWTERFIPVDGATECPTVNVCLSRGDYTGRTLRKQDGSYIFNIDIYTNATATADTPGDQRAMSQMTKIAGMIISILSNSAYQTLGFAPGLIRGLPCVRNFFVGYRGVGEGMISDALHDVVGRVRFEVGALETFQNFDTSALLTENFTHIIFDSTHGFFYNSTITA